MHTSKLFVLATLLTFVVCGYYEDHVCDHDNLSYEPEFLDVQEDMKFNEDGRLLFKSEPANIRIYAHYDLLDKAATPSFKAYIAEELAPPVIDYFQGLLKVKYPVIGNLKLDNGVARVCNVPAPDVLKGAGVAADYFIFYDADQSGGSTLAASRHCYLATGSKRPLIATTKFNSKQLLEAKGNAIVHEKNTYLLIHEMLHTFGFSDKLYNFFIDENGSPLKNHVKSKTLNGVTSTVVNLPPLTDRLRKHFGCPTLEGAYMENDGGSGTIGSHLERKLFVYEAMSTGAIDGRRVSEFSLALLEGTGWYLPNYDYAEPYFFGKNRGCEFMSQKCPVSNALFDEFCVGEDRGCAPHGRGGGKCAIDAKADGCKYYYPDELFDCENPDGEDNARFPDLQVFGRGAGSRCFTGTLNNRKSNNGKTSFCFKHTCKEENGKTVLDVQVGEHKIKCEAAGQREVNGYVGYFDCPDPVTFCSTVGKKYCPRNCMGRGFCINGTCECKTGFTGIDCALRL